MYGSYDLPVNINSEGIAIQVLSEGKRVFYHRDCLGSKQEKILLVSEGNVRLNPSEPLNLPDAVTPYLLVKMNKTLSVAPNSDNTIFLTFPVEIAVYLISKKSVHLLDVFSRAAQKFTLYGEPNNGVICKRWASGVFSDIDSMIRASDNSVRDIAGELATKSKVLGFVSSLVRSERS